jgi:hypothetical protein
MGAYARHAQASAVRVLREGGFRGYANRIASVEVINRDSALRLGSIAAVANVGCAGVYAVCTADTVRAADAVFVGYVARTADAVFAAAVDVAAAAVDVAAADATDADKRRVRREAWVELIHAAAEVCP